MKLKNLLNEIKVKKLSQIMHKDAYNIITNSKRKLFKSRYDYTGIDDGEVWYVDFRIEIIRNKNLETPFTMKAWTDWMEDETCEITIQILIHPKIGVVGTEDLDYDLVNVITHELEHVKQHDKSTHSNAVAKKYSGKGWEEYLYEDSEIEAHIRGIYEEAKKRKESFYNTAIRYFKANWDGLKNVDKYIEEYIKIAKKKYKGNKIKWN